MRIVARRISRLAHEVDLEGGHELIVDEPEDRGGADTGPRPTQLLAASLAGCTAITVEMYADRKEWELGTVEVSVDYEEPTADTPPSFEVRIRTGGELSDEQRDRILVIAGKCPVHRTLAAQDVKIEDSLETIEA